MKQIEALKEKKLINKKVTSIISEIQKYSSITSVEKPAFKSEEDQREHILKLIQSAKDLLDRKAKLKTMIDKTNIETKLRIPKGIISEEHEISIAEALAFKISYKDYLNIFNALNKNASDIKLRSYSNNTGDERVKSIQLYDENFKNNSLKDLQSKFDYIDAHLEMLNATTDVVA